MTDELKPVRCGGEAVTVQHELFDRIFKWRIHCMKCGIETRMFDTEAEAITAWNRAMGSIEKSSTVERTAKVTEVKTDDDVYDIKGVRTWCKEYRCEKCGFIQFAIEDHGRYTYCPSCGARLEWK